MVVAAPKIRAHENLQCFFFLGASTEEDGWKEHWPFFANLTQLSQIHRPFYRVFSSQRMTDFYPSFWCPPIRSPNPKKKHPNIQVHHYFLEIKTPPSSNKKTPNPKTPNRKKIVIFFPQENLHTLTTSQPYWMDVR